ncbi:MAG: 3-phosphoshikimate 1-carboxyvinyltransferase [Phycisphaerae bacterium]
MNTHTCQPVCRPLDATVTLPGSKSLTNRALIIAALADGDSVLRGLLLADDTRLMIDALRELGVRITVDETQCAAEVSGCGGHLPATEARLACGNAGTVMRFGAALVSLGQGVYELDGVARMHKRPIGELVDVLRALGAGVEYTGEEGYPPLIVHAAGLRGGHVSFESPRSSQAVSALLMVAPYARGDVFIDVRGDMPSVPYLRMTTAVMEHFGVAVIEQYGDRPRRLRGEAPTANPKDAEPPRDRQAASRTGSAARFIVEATQRYRAAHYSIEPDASGASYFLAAAAVAGGRVTVDGLGTESIQGDARFVDVLERMGCHVDREPRRLTVTGPPESPALRGIDVDLGDMPDTAQTLAAVSLFATGPTVIRNVTNLRIKETDRLAALRTELSKLGARVEHRSDGLTIHPPEQISPCRIDTYDDHRMAMSFALVGLRVPDIVINDPGCTAKTFPDFFKRFEAMTTGAR